MSFLAFFVVIYLLGVTEISPTLLEILVYVNIYTQKGLWVNFMAYILVCKGQAHSQPLSRFLGLD